MTDRTAEILDAAWAPEPDESQHDVVVVELEPRKCRRHRWRVADGGGDLPPVWQCLRCNRLRDDTLVRRGRSSRRLGHDGERRSEKRYGWRKTGEFGGIDDLQGRLAIVQQKTSRSAPPIRWKSILARLETRAAGRIPLLLLSYVSHGKETEDFIVIRGQDWLNLHGKDDPR